MMSPRGWILISSVNLTGIGTYHYEKVVGVEILLCVASRQKLNETILMSS